jgi:hypothetical protein
MPPILHALSIHGNAQTAITPIMRIFTMPNFAFMISTLRTLARICAYMLSSQEGKEVAHIAALPSCINPFTAVMDLLPQSC